MSGREGFMDSSVTESSSQAGRWAVGLVGGDWELGELAAHCAGSIRVDRCPEGWELMSDAFQDADDATAIRAIAGEMLRLINGIARVRLDRPEPISLGNNVRRYRDDGAKDVFVFPAPAQARLRMGTPSIAINGVLVSPRSWEPYVELATRDDRVWAVLTFLAIPPTWHSLYAALDTISKDQRTGGAKGVAIWANVTAGQLKLFRQTANSSRAIGADARHGPGYDAPPNPIAFADAEELVSHVVDAWLGELERVGPRT
jgi:hypothetical protein